MIKSIDALMKAYEENLPRLALRKAQANNNQERILMICGGTGCCSAGSMELLDELNKEIELAGLSDKVTAQITGCFGFCAEGPIVQVFPDDVFYVRVKKTDAKRIVNEHLVASKPIEDLLFFEPTISKKVQTMHEMSFYKKQNRIAYVIVEL